VLVHQLENPSSEGRPSTRRKPNQDDAQGLASGRKYELPKCLSSVSRTRPSFSARAITRHRTPCASSIRFMLYRLQLIMGMCAGTPRGECRPVNRQALIHFVNSGCEVGAQTTAASYRERGDL